MLTLTSTSTTLAVTHGKKLLLAHTAAAPLVTAVTLRSGTFPLLKLNKLSDTEFEFSDGDAYALRVTVTLAGDEAVFRFTPISTAPCRWLFRLPATRGEAVFGGGEQYRRLNLAGETVKNLVVEHITPATVLQKGVLPLSIYREKPHKKIGSYAPMPLFTTSGHELIYFETDAPGRSDFGSDAYTFCFEDCPAALHLVQKQGFAALAEVLTAFYPNRQYLPDWCHDGMILGAQGGTAAVLHKVETMQNAGAAVCGVWCQDWCGENLTAMGKQVWWNWQVDEALYPGLSAAIENLRAKGVRFLAYLNPYLVKGGAQYNECKAKGYLITHRDGSIYHIKSTTFDAGMLDLTNPAVQAYVKNTLIRKNMLELGIKGWMADFGEYLPMDCVLHEGQPAAWHNRWPVLWARLNREAVDEYGDPEVFFFTRSGYLGIQSYAPILWNGDQHTDTSRDYGLPCVLPASFSLGFSGVSLVHCDLGGFFSFGRMKRSPELTIRWAELCAFSPLMRSHESIRPDCNAQPYDAAVLPALVRLTNLHRALKPYLQACCAQAAQGIPALRPDFYPAGDYAAAQDADSYFLGDDLYIAPVLAEHTAVRTVTLPAGDWVHLFTGQSMAGGTALTVAAPLGTPAVFWRAESRFAPLFKSLADDKTGEN